MGSVFFMKNFLTIVLLFLCHGAKSQPLGVEINELNLTFAIDEQLASLRGIVHYTVSTENNGNQIILALYPQFTVDSVLDPNHQQLNFKHNSSQLIINFNRKFQKGEIVHFEIFYHGVPLVAKLPPWQGGWVVKKDSKNEPWITVACQQEGAQIWWPAFEDKCLKSKKTTITGIHNSQFQFVANGNLISKEKLNDQQNITTFELNNPISSYNISFGLGNYVTQLDTLTYESGNKLPIHVHILDADSVKSKQYLFTAIHQMLKAYEKGLGEYPFFSDGYGIIQTPYAGMEHQSGIAYGNQFKSGYLGIDFSGLQLPFDFILIHETGHEWFGNLISTGKPEDFWINEGFCTYAEKLFVKNVFGDSIAQKYLWQKEQLLINKKPIASASEVTDTDKYYKAALVIQTLETIINDDAKWTKMLSQFVLKHKNQCITTNDVLIFFGKFSTPNYDLVQILNQYLYETEIPIWEYQLIKQNEDLIIRHRLISKRKIQLPIGVKVKNSSALTINSNANWQDLTLEKVSENQVDIDRYGLLVTYQHVR